MIEILDGRDQARRLLPLQRPLLRLARDPRDLPFVSLSLAALVVLMPLAIAVFVVQPLPWWLAVAYLAVLFLGFIDRYTLMLHCTSHRRLYPKRFAYLNYVIPVVLAPLMGQTPFTYYAHHIGMHHPENNLTDDLSSTMRYRRDSVRGFLHYFGSFVLVGLPRLVAYHRTRGHRRLARMALLGELSYVVGVALLAWLNPMATLVVFIIPFVAMRFLMMAGNWAQHAFIDPADPANPYLNSITSINTRYNRRCFNDGYHIGHHVKANRHWTEMPADFEKNLDTYRAQGAVVFRGIDYFQIWALLMFKRYRTLARHVVDLSETPRSEADLIALLRARTRPVQLPATDLSARSLATTG
ncbi:MAG: fatty acid desaturase, partial [Myxococcales bacterium]|nr:fatty acid desaturase [Myxococcales bacterium]